MPSFSDLQQQVQQEVGEEDSQNSNKKRKDVLDGEEVMVDVLNKDDLENKESQEENLNIDIFDVLQLDDSLFEEIQDLDDDLIPPMFAAIQLAQQFLDPSLVFRALAEGDELSIQELKETLFDMAEDGIFPRDETYLARFSKALDQGIDGLEGGSGISDIQVYEVREIKSTVDSTLLAAQAMHSEVWEEDEETILAFQNLTKEDAEEVQEDFSNLDDDMISDTDRSTIEDPRITAIEIQEKLVDWWEMAQEEEYEVVDEDDLDEG
jgi:hypothetical protein